MYRLRYRALCFVLATHDSFNIYIYIYIFFFNLYFYPRMPLSFCLIVILMFILISILMFILISILMFILISILMFILKLNHCHPHHYSRPYYPNNNMTIVFVTFAILYKHLCLYLFYFRTRQTQV